jgi:hypothetical protein
LTVTDGTNAISTSTVAASNSDPGTGTQAGDWVASPNVTDLGGHGTDPSQLTFTAVAEVNGIRSESAFVTATKLSATTGDVTRPNVKLTNSPPSTWCHFGASPLIPATNVGGVLVGVCTPVFPSGTNTNGYGSWAQKELSGSVNDHVPGDFGLASEVADVKITIAGPNGFFQEFHSFTRRGTQAFFDVRLSINDYPPGQYQAKVSATDALGHISDDKQGQAFFTVTML